MVKSKFELTYSDLTLLFVAKVNELQRSSVAGDFVYANVRVGDLQKIADILWPVPKVLTPEEDKARYDNALKERGFVA